MGITGADRDFATLNMTNSHDPTENMKIAIAEVMIDRVFIGLGSLASDISCTRGRIA